MTHNTGLHISMAGSISIRPKTQIITELMGSDVVEEDVQKVEQSVCTDERGF